MNFAQSRSDRHILSWRQNSTGQVMRNTCSEKKKKKDSSCILVIVSISYAFFFPFSFEISITGRRGDIKEEQNTKIGTKY